MSQQTPVKNQVAGTRAAHGAANGAAVAGGAGPPAGGDALTFGIGGLGGTAGSLQHTGGTGTLGTLGGGGNSTQNNTAQKVLLHGVHGRDSLHGPGKMRPFEGPGGNLSRMDINVGDADHEARDRQAVGKQEGRRCSSLIEQSRNGGGIMLKSSKKVGDTKEDFAALEELQEHQDLPENRDLEDNAPRGTRVDGSKHMSCVAAPSSMASKQRLEGYQSAQPARNRSEMAL